MQTYNQEFILHASAVERYAIEEANARKNRIRAEEALLALMELRPEATTKAVVGRWKATAVTKLTRALDPDADLDSIRRELPPSYQDVISYAPKINLKRLREMQTHDSDAYGIFSRALTVTPAKTAVKVQQVEVK